MKYVYVIMCGCIGDVSVHDICSSRKKANAVVAEMKKDKFYKQTAPYIEQWEVK